VRKILQDSLLQKQNFPKGYCRGFHGISPVVLQTISLNIFCNDAMADEERNKQKYNVSETYVTFTKYN